MPKSAAPQPQSTPPHDVTRLLFPAQVADMLGITTAALAQLRYTGKGSRFIKVTGRQVRYDNTDVRQWLTEQTKDQT